MERRTFLATLAAPAVTGLIPRSDVVTASVPIPIASPPIAESEPTHFYYVRIERDADGNPVVSEAGASEATARGRYTKHDDPVKRVPFRPIAKPHRFRIVDVRWSPDGLRIASPDTIAYREACDSFTDPRSLIAVPYGLGGGDPQWLSPCDHFTREEGLGRIAERNGLSIEEATDDPQETLEGITWSILVEVGRTIVIPDVEFDIESNGMGVMKVEYQRPVRVVYPTADEMARFPLPARDAVKGGAQ